MIRTVKPEAANIRTNAGKTHTGSPIIASGSEYAPTPQRLRINAGKPLVAASSQQIVEIIKPQLMRVGARERDKRAVYPYDGSIVLSQLAFNYDFAYSSSYPGSGSTVTNVIDSTLYNGTLVNSPSFTSDFGGALNLVRASNQAINLTDILDGVFTFSDAKFSIEIWCKFNTLANDTSYQLCAKLGDSTFSENQRQFFWTARNLTAQSFGGVRLDFVYYGDLAANTYRGVRSNTATLSTGQVYQLVLTFDNTITTNDGLDRVRFYINSSSQSRTLWLNLGTYSSIQNATARLGIGGVFGTSQGPVSCLDGQIYSASIYNKVLSASEVLQNWNGKRARFGL